MTATTMEARLSEIGRRIDGLYADSSSSVDEKKSRMQRHVDALWQGEAAARAAVCDAYGESRRALSDYADAVDYRVRLLELELDAAEASLRAEIAEDRHALGDAVAKELRALDLYLERLQARAATNGGGARADAEDAIRELRARRNTFEHRLDQIRAAPNEALGELKVGVSEARSELARTIDATAAKFD